MSGTDPHPGTPGTNPNPAGGPPPPPPGQPAPGQPAGQPAYGQGFPPPPPGQGFPPPPPGQQFPPPPHGGPQPGQPGQPGQPVYGRPPSGPPPGGGGKSNKALWVILGGIAAFLVLAILAIVVLVSVSGGDEEGGTAGGPAENQSAAVKNYLEALADGDAKKALSLTAVEPLDTSFLTDEVLQASAEMGKITDIRVGEVANEYTSLVPATFKVGDQAVTEDFYVAKAGDGWKMKDAGSEIDFTNMRSNTLPLLVNGTALDADKVMLFPGVYELSTGSDYVSYGTGKFTVKSNNDYLSSSDLTPALTPAGEKAYVSAVKESTDACLQKRDLSPANCPNQAGSSQTYKIEKDSIKWRQRGTNPFANLRPRLDFDNPNIATSRPSLQLEITADCNSSSGRCNLRTYSSSEATVDMTADSLKVKWTD